MTKCILCLGCTGMAEKNFVEPKQCINFVEDRTNKEKEYEQVNFKGGGDNGSQVDRKTKKIY